MNTAQRLEGGAVTNTSFVGSRAYTFLDSYIHNKQRNYNALYAKNMEILKIEDKAIRLKSPSLLYNAYYEQMRIVDSIVDRILNFAILIKNDVEENIAQIMPDNDMLMEFKDAVAKVGMIPRFKYVHYDTICTNYININEFFNLFKQEIKEICTTNDMTAQNENPIIHSRATTFLENMTDKQASPFTSMLDCEKIKLMSLKKLKGIVYFFERKSVIRTIVNVDFKSFMNHLRQYKQLYRMTTLLEPTIRDNQIELSISGTKASLSFNDYLVVYKHFSSIAKSLLQIVDYYNSRFFNKIYSIQSNIEVYKSIMDDVIYFAKNKDEVLSEASNTYNDTYGLISGNDPDIAHAMLNDNVEVDNNDEDMSEFEIEPDKEAERVIDAIDSFKKNNNNQSLMTTEGYNQELYESIVEAENELMECMTRLSTFQPIDIMSNPDRVMTEAVQDKKQAKEVVNNIVAHLRDANARFKNFSMEIRKKSPRWMEKAKYMDLNEIDFSNFSKDIFPYWNSIPKVFDSIRIPEFTTKDKELYQGKIGFMKTYFKNIVNDNGNVNKNILRGLTVTSDKRKIRIQYGQVKSAYPKIYKLLPIIQKCRVKVSKEMVLVSNTLKRLKNMEIPLSESTLLSMSIFRNNYFDVLMEDAINNLDGEENNARPIEPNEQENKTANDAMELISLCIKWARLCTQVISAEMDILDEAYTQCTRFISKVIKTSKLSVENDAANSDKSPYGLDDEDEDDF